MSVEHVDVLVVGAGPSGIGAACHLTRELPGKTYTVLEARGAIGGTWDLFRYPGVRSDSDMFTLGYRFRPWTEARAIADGPSIRQYVVDTAEEYGVVPHIRFGHRVVSAAWSSADARWTVTAEHEGRTVALTCSWLSVCTGYYRYDQGHTPVFEGAGDFTGRVVHPQHWPADLDHTGTRVVVIGSGATAVTLVPSLSRDAEHVTMLQRTPSYVVALPGTDPLAALLQRRLPPRIAHPVVRWKNILMTTASYQLARRRPELMKKLIRAGLLRQLPVGYDVDTHFTPPYQPWDQRLCLAPDGDLFQALGSGRASVVTGEVDRFTPTGVRLRSGEELPADVVVTATGLDVLAMGGMTVSVDGRPVELSETVSYKGMMLSGVPNLAMVIGYVNNSWTLKADLVNRYVTRLVRYLDAHDLASATPVAPPEGGSAPFLGLSAGYVRRSLSALPTQGARAPWKLNQDYLSDLLQLGRGPLRDQGMTFQPRVATPTERAVA